MYLHLDKKADFSLHVPGLKLVERQSVYWGSHNQIKATLSLFKAAHEQKYNRYVLISGQDLPIKKNSEILNFLKKHPQTQFLEFNVLPVSWWGAEKGIERLKYYYLKSDLTFIQKLSAKLVYWQKKYRLVNRKINFNAYAGANWMNLTHDAVSYILDYTDNHPEYLKRFRFTHCADEIYFQSILLNSSFSEHCENNTLRYFNWIKGPEFPRTLRMDDLNDIIKSDALFARKFDESVDSEIIKEIYKRIED